MQEENVCVSAVLFHSMVMPESSFWEKTYMVYIQNDLLPNYVKFDTN